MRRAAVRRWASLALVVALLGAVAPLAPFPPAGADGNEAPGSPAAYRRITTSALTTCALPNDGGLRCWGDNEYGQLGTGDTGDRGDQIDEVAYLLSPIPLGTGRTATEVGAGYGHTCALLDNGTVKCWGRNDVGQLGLGDTVNRGDNPGEMGDQLPPVDLGTGRTATAIAVGDQHTCAVLDNSTVKCWGQNSSGQLGLEDVANRGDGPGEMGDQLPALQLGSGRNATAVGAGYAHTCALLDNGTVKCWGFNANGQLGLGDTYPRGYNFSQMGDNLAAVALGTGRTATAISTGALHTCAILDDGTAKCWGRGNDGQLGGATGTRGDQPGEMGDNLPAFESGLAGIATTTNSTCVVRSAGSVRCYGYIAAVGLASVDFGTGRTAVAAAAGGDHLCATLDDGALKCAGAGANGVLGLGDTQSRGISNGGPLGDLLPASLLMGPGLIGRVTGGSGGQVLPGSLVAALDTTTFDVVAGQAADNAGRFRFALPAGSYYLYTIEPSGSFAPALFGSPTMITVTDQVTTVDPVLAPRYGAITGTVTETGSGTPVPNALVLAINTSTGAPETGVVANGSGQFTLSGLVPGNHWLAYLDPTGAHATRFHPSAPGVDTAVPVSVTAGNTTSAPGTLPSQPLVGGGSAITGRVTETGTGTALSGAFVVALRAGDLSFARATRTNSTGGYAFNLTAGGYKLGFIDPTGLHAMEWFDGQSAPGLGAATTVVAPDAANATLDPLTGAMSGNVRSGGTAVAGAWVVALGPSGPAGAAVTTSNGGYRITNLPAGTYRAAIVHAPSSRYRYWLDTTVYEEAVVFRITAGGDQPIDTAL